MFVYENSSAIVWDMISCGASSDASFHPLREYYFLSESEARALT